MGKSEGLDRGNFTISRQYILDGLNGFLPIHHITIVPQNKPTRGSIKNE